MTNKFDPTKQAHSAILVRKGSSEAVPPISAYDQPTDFKVGDRVYCFVRGEGTVTEVDRAGSYKIGVNFNIDDVHAVYTQDGLFYTGGLRTLFFSKPDVLGGGRLTPVVSEETQKAIDLLKDQGYTVSKD